MSRELVALLEKRTTVSGEPITLPQTPRAKARRGGFRPCSRNCGRFVRVRNEDQCTQCRITFVPPHPAVQALEQSHAVTMALSDPASVKKLSEIPLASEFSKLQDLLRDNSAVQPFPEYVLLSDWDAALLAT